MQSNASHYRTFRTGFSQIELLVVIGVLALLLAFLLVAVQKPRETARRLDCSSRLRQIGIAVESYVDLHRMYPTAVNGNWSTMLLSLLGYPNEEAQWKEIIAGRVPLEELSPVPMYRCPTDPMAVDNRVVLSYNMNDGEHQQVCQCCNGLHHSCGKDWILAPVAPGDVTDGLAQTAAFSEMLVLDNAVVSGLPSDQPALWPRLVRDVPIPTLKPTAADYQQFRDNCKERALPPGSAWSYATGSPFSLTGPWYNHIMTPNQNSCYSGGLIWYHAYTANSLHPNGVNVLFADSSVHFIANEVDEKVWHAMGTRNGGEVYSIEF